MDTDKKKWKLFAKSSIDLPSISDLATRSLDASLWCLYISKHEFGIDYLSYEELENILREFLDIPIKIKQIKKAFARAGTKVIKNSKGEGYKISRQGEESLRSLKKGGPLHIMYIEPNKPRSAKENLEFLVKSIPKGTLLISDPYYGTKTLKVLETFITHHKEIKFLSAKVGGGEKTSVLNSEISDFKREFGRKIELRLATSSDLHDRYIIAKNTFFIVGHGIKDLGNKESLIVAVDDRYGKDIRKLLEKTFYERWNKATVI